MKQTLLFSAGTLLGIFSFSPTCKAQKAFFMIPADYPLLLELKASSASIEPGGNHTASLIQAENGEMVNSYVAPNMQQWHCLARKKFKPRFITRNLCIKSYNTIAIRFKNR